VFGDFRLFFDDLYTAVWKSEEIGARNSQPDDTSANDNYLFWVSIHGGVTTPARLTI
jgi:hypothetical protein